MTTAQQQHTFADSIIEQLADAGVTAYVSGTGGGCEAVQIDLGTAADGYEDYVLITDGDAALPDGVGAYVGRYKGDADPIDFLSTDNEVTVEIFVAAALRAVA